MNRKTYSGYLNLFQKYGMNVKVIDESTLEIRGMRHEIRQYDFFYLADVVLGTDHLIDITYYHVKALYKAIQKANNSLMHLYYFNHLEQSKKTIEVFIQLVNNKDPEREQELLLKIHSYLNQKAS